MKLNPEFEYHLQNSLQKAHSEKYEIFSIEHLVLCVVNIPSMEKLFTSIGLSKKELIAQLEEYIEKNIPKKKKSEMPPVMSVGAQRMLQNSWHHAVSSGKSQVIPADILVSLYGEDESFALHLLQDKMKISRLAILNEISHGESSKDDSELEAGEQFQTAVDVFCTDWSESGKTNQIEDFIARDYLLKRLVQILSRKTRNNPLLLGDSGVGKSSLARSLAKKINSGDVPPNLKDLRFIELHISKLVAGAKFRGELEERFGHLYNELSNEEADSILFIDDIASLLNTGGNQGQGMDISHMLRPILENQKIHVIACCNHKEFKSIFEKNNTNTRFFQKLVIEECSKDEAITIVKSKIGSYENYHKVQIPEESIIKSIDLAQRYLSERKLPDSALDLIDETCAREKLKSKASKKISSEELSVVISDMSGVSTENLDSTEGTKLKNLDRNIKSKIFGQDKAVDALVHAIKYSFAGLAKEHKPIGCYLFAGPTGVGKTELAIQLSENLGLKFEKFDMSEYLEKHSVARLVGAPPGYVGYEEGGLLTEAISKHPYSVILMDELEKAHPDLINVLLQIMDSGKLTDANGKQVDCRNIVLILTTNAGSKDQAKGSIGIGPASFGNFDINQLKNHFSPEFLNRIDSIVDFKPLDKTILTNVTNKFLQELKEQLEAKKVFLSYDEKVVKLIVDKAYDPQYGARPLQRKIDDIIKKPLVDEILYGKLSKGGKLSISVSAKELKFNY